MRRTIPLEDFFKKPDKLAVQISPNGHYVAYMEPWKRRLNIFVMHLETGDVRQLTQMEERDIYYFFWANDNRIVYGKDTGGDENVRLYAIDREGANALDLTPFDRVRCDVVDDLKDQDEFILIQMNQRDPQIFDVYRLNVLTGELEMIVENPGNFMDFHTDHEGKLRLAVGTDGVNETIYYRATEQASWKQVASYNFKQKATPLTFTFDNQALYVSSNVGRDKTAIFEYNLETGKEGPLIYEHPDVDVDELRYSRKRKKLTAIVYEKEYKEYAFLDEEQEKVQRFLEENLPGVRSFVTSKNREETIFTIRTYSDRNIGSYYCLNVETWELKKLFDLAPWLKEEELAEMKPITVKSRDGLDLHGYLTLPLESTGKQLPMVVFPHGGPYGVRNSWGMDSEAQFLVNRGFAVLQLNFRGSGGYGIRFKELGYKQWGKTMQDDLSDGVQWAVEQGIADPKKVAIFGVSYGGYATLAGLAFTPDLYACGVDYVGPANLFTLLDSIPPYWEPIRKQLYEEVGDPVEDAELFRAISPVFHAEKIKAPLFVAQGANDPRVKQAESDQIVEALKSQGVEVEYMLKEDEGHGFEKEENQIDFFRAMEKFLKKHIPTSL